VTGAPFARLPSDRHRSYARLAQVLTEDEYMDAAHDARPALAGKETWRNVPVYRCLTARERNVVAFRHKGQIAACATAFPP